MEEEPRATPSRLSTVGGRAEVKGVAICKVCRAGCLCSNSRTTAFSNFCPPPPCSWGSFSTSCYDGCGGPMEGADRSSAASPQHSGTWGVSGEMLRMSTREVAAKPGENPAYNLRSLPEAAFPTTLTTPSPAGRSKRRAPLLVRGVSPTLGDRSAPRMPAASRGLAKNPWLPLPSSSPRESSLQWGQPALDLIRAWDR